MPSDGIQGGSVAPPTTLTDLLERFADADDARAFVEAVRWPDGFVCPRCGAADGWRTARAHHVCKACAKHTSVTAGTLFDGSRLPLRTWLAAIWLIASERDGVTARELQRDLGIGSYKAAWGALHRLRAALEPGTDDPLDGVVQLGLAPEVAVVAGAGDDIQVLVAVTKRAGGEKVRRARLVVVPDTSGAAIREAVTVCCAAGATLAVPEGKAFRKLEKHGWATRPLAPGEVLAQRVEANVVAWLQSTHRGAVGATHLQAYLSEYAFRCGRGKERRRGELFLSLLRRAVQPMAAG